MKKSVLVFCINGLFAVLLFAGCVDLNQVNGFAAASSKAAQEYESLPVNFRRLCLDKCTETDIKNQKLNPPACDCRDAAMADSVDDLFYNRVEAYLDGLVRLSADNLTNYNVDTLAENLAGKNWGGLQLSSEQAGAYAKLGSILAKTVTDGYRRKKIELYIREANQPLSVVIGYLRFNVERNLASVMKARQTTLRGDYFDMVNNNKAGTPYEKRKLIEEYYALRAQLDDQVAQLLAYGKALQVIAEGHQKLYDNLGKLGLPAVKAMAAGYAANIKDINAQIRLLKK